MHYLLITFLKFYIVLAGSRVVEQRHHPTLSAWKEESETLQGNTELGYIQTDSYIYTYIYCTNRK